MGLLGGASLSLTGFHRPAEHTTREATHYDEYQHEASEQPNDLQRALDRGCHGRACDRGYVDEAIKKVTELARLRQSASDRHFKCSEEQTELDHVKDKGKKASLDGV